jgi:prepilin-type N-terminal cleavage/methylation domain-containing protein
MRWAKSESSSSRGFTLVETLVATAILATVSLGVAQMFILATDQTRGGKFETTATTLAEQKMEQLRGLSWGYDNQGLGLPETDTTTNLAVNPPDNTGTGLNPSPTDVLEANTDGFVDYLDMNGQYLGTGATPPAGATYIRRWSVEPLPTNPNNTLVLQVFVTTPQAESRRGAENRRRLSGDAWLVTVKTRKAQ